MIRTLVLMLLATRAFADAALPQTSSPGPEIPVGDDARCFGSVDRPPTEPRSPGEDSATWRARSDAHVHAWREVQIIDFKRRIQLAEVETETMHLDEPLFHLALLELHEGRTGDAREHFKRLIKNYPISSRVPATFAAFGDYYLSTGDFSTALTFYDKVLQYSGSNCQEYAMLQSARCAERLGDGKTALARYVQVAQSPRSDEAERSRAISDMRAPFSALAHADRAWSFIARIPLTDAQRLQWMDALAVSYELRHQPADAATVRQEIARHAPAPPN